MSPQLNNLLNSLAGFNSEIVLLAILMSVGIIVISLLSAHAKRKTKSLGLSPAAKTVSIDGSKAVPVRHYVSEMQGLAGKPDALISENGFIIPVERKPLARKLRDRYTAQLLVYMRLVEEFEGKKPPYGYLILGPNCRKVKIDNSPARQAWLQSYLDQMHAILNGADPVPDPDYRKCIKCDVNAHCTHAILQPAQIHRRVENQ